MDQVLELLQSLLQQAASLDTELTEEEKSRVLEIFQGAIELVQKSQSPTVPSTGTPEVPSGPYPSSNVNGFKYDPKSGELLVQFHGPYPQAEGSVYSYQKVPPYIYDLFARGAIGPKTSGENSYHRWIKGVTPSLGGSLNALLKAGGYQYQKLS